MNGTTFEFAISTLTDAIKTVASRTQGVDILLEQHIANYTNTQQRVASEQSQIMGSESSLARAGE